jgi:two-component system, LytTR family, response regulator
MRAILVDDEKELLMILERMISRHVPELEIIATCNTTEEAIGKITALKPDVLFLDIQLRETTGFDLLNKLPTRDFEVIFTTSHESYALKALKAGALDYLVKPVQLEELMSAVQKVRMKRMSMASTQQLEMLMSYFKPAKPKVKRIALTASDHLIFVDTNDVIYCESDSNYTTFFLVSGEKVVISKTLKDVEEILENDGFFRIHASYLVNMKHVSKFTRGDGGHVVMSNNQQLTVSRKKKEEFFEMFSRL